MKRILITGSKGYIGQHLKKMMADITDIDIIGMDIKCNNNHSDIRSIDIKNHYDTIIHLAALVKVGESVQQPANYYDTNIIGTMNLMKKTTYDNFIFASTGAAEYPLSPYALSKRVAEDIVRDLAPVHTIFRFYNVVGSDGFEPTNPDGLHYNLLKAVERGYLNLYGDDYDTIDGTCIREYIHVNDICRGLIKAIDTPSSNIENLAYGDPKSVMEIINIFKKVNNVDFEVRILPRRDGDLKDTFLKIPSRYTERNYTYEDMLKI
jgi:UDP-glucose 4-epimerase